MTPQPPAGAPLPPPVDEANPLLAPGPAMLITGASSTGAGIITIRTPTTTLTVQLPRAQVLAWGKMITELGEGMGGSGLLAAVPVMPGLIRPGR
jgi:hypothetical protein